MINYPPVNSFSYFYFFLVPLCLFFNKYITRHTIKEGATDQDLLYKYKLIKERKDKPPKEYKGNLLPFYSYADISKYKIKIRKVYHKIHIFRNDHEIELSSGDIIMAPGLSGYVENHPDLQFGSYSIPVAESKLTLKDIPIKPLPAKVYISQIKRELKKRIRYYLYNNNNKSEQVDIILDYDKTKEDYDELLREKKKNKKKGRDFHFVKYNIYNHNQRGE